MSCILVYNMHSGYSFVCLIFIHVLSIVLAIIPYVTCFFLIKIWCFLLFFIFWCKKMSRLNFFMLKQLFVHCLDIWPKCHDKFIKKTFFDSLTFAMKDQCSNDNNDSSNKANKDDSEEQKTNNQRRRSKKPAGKREIDSSSSEDE